MSPLSWNTRAIFEVCPPFTHMTPLTFCKEPDMWQYHSHPVPVVRSPNGHYILSGKAWTQHWLARHLREILGLSDASCLFQWWYSVNLYPNLSTFPFLIWNLDCVGFQTEYKKSLQWHKSWSCCREWNIPRPHSEGQKQPGSWRQRICEWYTDNNPDQVKTETFP